MAEVMQGERSTVVDITCSGPLSAPWEILQSPLDDVVLSNIWEKVAKIVTSPGAIQPAPFFPSKQTTENTFLVVSESGCENFHPLNVIAVSALWSNVLARASNLLAFVLML